MENNEKNTPKFCPQCGYKIDGVKFCPQCGRKAEEMPTPKETAAFAQNKTTEKAEETPTPKETAAFTQNETTAKTEETPTPKETAAFAQNETTAKTEETPTPKETVAFAQNETTAKTEETPTPKETVAFAQNETTAKTEETPNTAPLGNTPPQKGFYKATWFMWLSLIFLPPLGIVLMWRFHPEKRTNAKIILTAAFLILFMIQLSMLGTGEDTASTPTKEATKAAAEKEDTDTKKTLTGITAAYSGSTEEGAILDNDAKIKVTATYDDGSKKTVSDWQIQTPVTLAPGETAEAVVSYKGMETTLTVVCTTVTKEMYMESCQNIGYEELARNPDNNVGEYITFTGEIIQVQEDGNSAVFRINVTKGEYGIWTNTVFVAYEYTAGESRFLEDDIVTFYGIYTGLYTYETVLGSEMTIPSMSAEYMNLN